MKEILFSSWGGRIVDNRGREPQAYEPVTDLILPEEFKQDERIQALAGWAGIIVRSPEVDVIDLCRAHLEALQEESKKCDKCNYCRTGYNELLEVFQDILNGEAREEDMEFLQSAAEAIQESGKCSIGKFGPIPLLQALQQFHGDFSRAVAGERGVKPGRYRSKLTSPCMDACPIHLDIPNYVGSIKEAKFAESLEVIRERLPVAGVVGRVCFRPCERNCRRANVDEPIAIRALKRFVADHELSVDKKPEYLIVPSDRTGRVAIVGAGPAGITCAYHLARKGHQVTIYERWAEPGGMSAMGIPDYRLPRSILNREVGWIQRMGVTILFRQTVGEDVSLSQLEGEFDAVFIGIGAQQSAALGIRGEREGHQGLVHGLQYLREIKEGRDPHPEGRRVAVIGGGNVAIDCARSSFRVHKKEVNVVYRRGRHEMPADDEEIRDAEAEGVRFHFLTSPIQILATDGHVTGLRCIRMTLGEPDHSGRPRPLPVEGSEFVLQCDTVVPAVGQRIDPGFLDGAEGLEVTGWNGIVVDPDTKQAHRPKIFSAGDCETGPDSLIAACAGGRQAARNIDRFINGLPLLASDEENCFDRLFQFLRVYDPEERIAKVEARERKHPPKLSLETRVSSFEEVEQAFSGPEAIAEAERCLRCYYVVTVAV